jgi:hypothetical protein
MRVARSIIDFVQIIVGGDCRCPQWIGRKV